MKNVNHRHTALPASCLKTRYRRLESRQVGHRPIRHVPEGFLDIDEQKSGATAGKNFDSGHL
jgi:hypothetical protein